MEPTISSGVMFLSSTKAIWESIHETFSMEKNVSRVYEVYQNLFLLQQVDKPVSEYYNFFKGLMDELNQYHPVTNDIDVLKKQREEFYVSKFLSGLHSNLQSVKSQILAGDGSIPSLSNVYSRVVRVTTKSSSSSKPIGKENSALVTSMGHRGAFRGRGNFPSNTRGRGGRGFGNSTPVFTGNRGRGGSSGRGRGFGRGRGSLYCTHCGGDNHTVNRCYDLYGKPWETSPNLAFLSSDNASGAH